MEADLKLCEHHMILIQERRLRKMNDETLFEEVDPKDCDMNDESDHELGPCRPWGECQ